LFYYGNVEPIKDKLGGGNSDSTIFLPASLDLKRENA